MAKVPLSPPPTGIDALEWAKLWIDREKARLDFRKFIWGSVVVAIALATIPPSFQLATAFLEKVKTDADRRLKQQADRDGYIKDFLDNALNQDIELRIRFSEYFSHLAAEPKGWIEYKTSLVQQRNTAREKIDTQERQWRELQQRKKEERDEVKTSEIERNLEWLYKEVGYVARNRSAAQDPRSAPTAASTPQDVQIQKSRYQVFVQFAGTLAREDVKAAMQKLLADGWKVQGVDGGGERIASAAGLSDIRYGDAEDQSAAQLLAQQLQTYNLTPRTIVARRNPVIEKGKLEIWVSR